jgi:hypothetical protein
LEKFAGWFLKYRYLLLCLILILLMGLRTNNGLWVGDFWEHSSVIRELATNPLHPKHPQLLSDAPHAFYSPYALALGIFSRFTKRSSIETLALAGMVNLVLFLVGLFLFMSVVAPHNRSGVAFYTLLLILLFWGAAPWNYSGFYHLSNLGYVIPYPSTFSMALALIALAMNQKRLQARRDLWLLPIFLIAVIVLLTHQITFLFLASGLVAMTLQAKGSFWIEALKMAGILLLAFGLSAFWPYYPFIKLVFSGSGVYHLENREMYHNVWIRTWPLLIGIPLLVVEARTNRRGPLVWMFLMLLGVYLLGAVTGAYSYGRAIAYLALILDTLMAIYLVKLEMKLSPAASPGKQMLFSIGFTALLIALTFKPLIQPMIGSLQPEIGDRYEKYYFLSQYTGQYEVILSDLNLSAMVPTFGGKVVAFYRPLAFISDQQERRSEVARFFSENATTEYSQKVINKYQVKYVLLEKTDSSNWEAIRARIAPFTELVYRGKRFLLFVVNTSKLSP